MKKDFGNVILGILILLVGTVCLYPVDESAVEVSLQQPYRSGNSTDGVSLTFNVYEGRETVYQILDVLDNFQAKATFYIGGCWADDNADCVKEIFKRGHEIGNHGYFHKSHDKLSRAENEREISICNEFLRLCTGVTPTLFAPPSGAYNDVTLSVCESLNMKTVLWSRDTIDWRDRDENIIFERATKNIKSGEIILMHPYTATLNALDDILKYYQTCNLRQVTVSENIQDGG